MWDRYHTHLPHTLSRLVPVRLMLEHSYREVGVTDVDQGGPESMHVDLPLSYSDGALATS